jgi:hypothetical protein
MGLNDFNEMAANSGGKWIKLRELDATVAGELIDTEEREKTYKGKVVLSSKTNKPRREIVVTLKVDDRTDDEDDGIRKIAADESMQRALIAAAKKTPFVAGGRLAIKCVRAPESETDQAGYDAAFAPPKKDLSPKPSADLADLLG